jgi:hypothetical protein
VNWNWDPHTWKKPIRVLLGLATVWPIIYIGLFFVLIFSGILFGAVLGEPTQQHPRELDLIQLERKIQNGEVRQLRVTANEIQAVDREGRNFHTDVSSESTREEIIRQARELDSNGRPRVGQIDEDLSEPRVTKFLPVGFLLLFAFHMLTILLMFLLMPLYIILAVKNERLDQTMRIVWVVLTCTIGMFANPVYWYLHVWRTAPPVAPPAATSEVT